MKAAEVVQLLDYQNDMRPFFENAIEAKVDDLGCAIRVLIQRLRESEPLPA